MKILNNNVFAERNKFTMIRKDQIKTRWQSFKKNKPSDIPNTICQSYRSSKDYIKRSYIKKNEIFKRNLSLAKKDPYYTKESYNKIYIAIDMIIAS